MAWTLKSVANADSVSTKRSPGVASSRSSVDWPMARSGKALSPPTTAEAAPEYGVRVTPTKPVASPVLRSSRR